MLLLLDEYLKDAIKVKAIKVLAGFLTGFV
jgi:hypothetical protein